MIWGGLGKQSLEERRCNNLVWEGGVTNVSSSARESAQELRALETLNAEGHHISQGPNSHYAEEPQHVFIIINTWCERETMLKDSAYHV